MSHTLDHDRSASYLALVRAACPHVAATRLRALGAGQSSDAILVDDQWVFRFPRHPRGVARLAIEVAVLTALRGRVTLPIPDPIHHLLGGAPGEAFIGYRLLPGVPLTRPLLEAQPPSVRRRIAAQLARFLRDVHAVPIASIGVAVPPVATVERIAEMNRRVRAHLFPRMRPDARRAVAAHFARFLADAPAAAVTPALIHADLGPGNILVDPDRGALTGVIDFGDCGLGDPAYDLAGPLSAYGEPFLDLLITAEPRLAADAPRAPFFAGIFALEEALFGLDRGDHAALAAGLAPYV